MRKNGGKKASNKYTERKNKGFDGKIKKDEKRGMNHGVGVALKVNLIPDWMKHVEMKKTTNTKTCPFYGCLGKYVITKTKGCNYNGIKNDDELNDRIQAYLEEIYPAHYGECCKYPIPYQS